MGTTSYSIVLTDLQAIPCLVVGGGGVAERKISALLEADAQITVISPTQTATIRRWADDGRVRVLERVFEADDVSGCALVIAATNDRQVNAAIARTARATGVLVNVVDDPAAGSFITPATIRRGDLLLSVTTGGHSPVVAALVRRTLEHTIGDEYSMLLDLIASLRHDLRDELPPSVRAALMRALATDDMLEWLRTGQHERVSAFVTQQLVLAHQVPTPLAPPPPREKVEPGTVSLVGAGPGDPGLLTLKGMRLLNTADAVVYDDLANDALLEHCGPGTERYPMGKRGGKGSTPQQEIDALLLSLAQKGKRVVRLKGGDPYMFGRGATEAEVLQNHGIPWEVVPGVSSGYAAPAVVGIPLTHRDWSSSVAFVTGHADPAQEPRVIDWKGLATSVDTLVVYMGVRYLRAIVAQVMAGGRDPSTPVAVIECATTDMQRTIISTLANVADAAAQARVSAPAIIVIGEVVGARLPSPFPEMRVESEHKPVLVAFGEHI